MRIPPDYIPQAMRGRCYQGETPGMGTPGALVTPPINSLR